MDQTRLEALAHGMYEATGSRFTANNSLLIVKNAQSIYNYKLGIGHQVDTHIITGISLAYGLAKTNKSDFPTITSRNLQSVGYSKKVVNKVIKSTNKIISGEILESLDEKIASDAINVWWISLPGVLTYTELEKKKSSSGIIQHLANQYQKIELCEGIELANRPFVNFMNQYNRKVLDYIEPKVFRKEGTIDPKIKLENSKITVSDEFTLFSYAANFIHAPILVIGRGDYQASNTPVPTRFHSECMASATFRSRLCDCDEQMQHALQYIDKSGRGLIVFDRQEGRGIGIANKITSLDLQQKGKNTRDANVALGYSADGRDYRASVMVLQDLGVESVSLITRNKGKIKSIEKYGLKVDNIIEPALALTDRGLKHVKEQEITLNHIPSDHPK